MWKGLLEDLVPAGIAVCAVTVLGSGKASETAEETNRRRKRLGLLGAACVLGNRAAPASVRPAVLATGAAFLGAYADWSASAGAVMSGKPEGLGSLWAMVKSDVRTAFKGGAA